MRRTISVFGVLAILVIAGFVIWTWRVRTTCCATIEPSSAGASIVDVYDIEALVYDVPVSGPMWGEDVAYSNSITVTTIPSSYCICGYGERPTDIEVAFTYGVSTDGVTFSYRDPVPATFSVIATRFGWRATISTPDEFSDGMDGSEKVSTTPEVDLRNPTGVLVGVSGAYTSSALSTYGPVHIKQK